MVIPEYLPIVKGETPMDALAALAPTAEPSDRLEQALKIFNIRTLKPEQETLIDASLAGHDTFGILPTGFGKSACYQIPGYVASERTIVVSPLIALQEDQVQMLRKRGIRAFTYHSGLSEVRRAAARFYYHSAPPGSPSFLYVAPETLVTQNFRKHFGGVHFDRIAVDEAHCVSTWGSSFRPDYQQIARIAKRMDIKNFSAFTALVDPRIERDIMRRFPLRPGFVRVEADPFRPNLLINIERTGAGQRMTSRGWHQKLKRLLALLSDPTYAGPTIVYCNTRNGSANLYNALRENIYLRELGYRPYLFHAELPYEDKDMALSGFLKDEKPIVIATSAFGLGIDRADVRQIVHFNLPFSLIDYVQQIGRGGRDGKPTLCTTFYAPSELPEVTGIAADVPTIEFVERTLGNIQRMYARLPKDRQKSFSTGMFTRRMTSMVEENEKIQHKGMYLSRISSSIALLREVGLIREDEDGIKIFKVIPGTPPHNSLIERTQMGQRMRIRESEKMGTFFRAEEPTQPFLLDLVRAQ